MNDRYFQEELDRLESAGNYRRLMPAEHSGCDVVIGGRRMLDLSSNDYLGLAADIGLRKEFMAGLSPENFQMSSSSSRSLSGDFPVHEQVERQLAAMFGREAALVFNSGYHMNIGILPAIAGKDTLIVADKLVHASLIDGIRLSGAPFCRFRHNNTEQLETMLKPDFRILYAEETAAVLRFTSAADVLRHLKMTGVNGISRRPWTRKDYSAFCTSYSERFADADGCPLTYRPVFVVAVRRYREDASGM